MFTTDVVFYYALYYMSPSRNDLLNTQVDSHLKTAFAIRAQVMLI